MKFGVKTYDDEKFLNSFENKCDFFEVQAIQGKNYSFLKKYKLPIVIHCEHQVFGVNIADSSKKDFNLKAINFAKKIAESISATKIIIHPGDLDNENCSKENSINFLKENCDKRFCIENLPFRNVKNNKKLCASPKEMKEFLIETNLGFCFDINHAIEYSLSEKLDYWKVLKKFEELKPTHYHLGGENMDKGESHLSFCDSNLDLRKVFEILNKNAEITLEVSLDDNKTKKDLIFIQNITKSKL
ncbi:hypothetical protein KAR52_02875 [Candidatus Pacearchaeota archaeon]|nr:hypothetical protein [Candidatus Pacearchaeota archaeon]